MEGTQLHVTPDGAGTAAVLWAEIEHDLRSRLRSIVQERLGRVIDIVEIRLLDADGRELAVPPQSGVMMLGFVCRT